ncbi:nucleoside diphosphate kinase, partial [Rozella allomycis CSF55]
VDDKTKKIFLKRAPYPNITIDQVYLGATITVYSRPMTLVNFGDERTRKVFKTESLQYKISILLTISEFLVIAASKDNKKCLDEIYSICHTNNTQIISIDLVSAYILPQNLREKLPRGNVIVAKLKGDPRNVCENANIVLPDREQCEKEISDDFNILAIKTVRLTLAEAEEFMEVYQNVLPEYHLLINELIAGNCVAIQARPLNGANAVTSLREYAGPYDPEIAKLIKPDSLRARFGNDKIQNAIHCTDLIDDAPLEVS